MATWLDECKCDFRQKEADQFAQPPDLATVTEENEPSGNSGETPSSGGGIQITASSGGQQQQEEGGGETQQEEAEQEE